MIARIGIVIACVVLLAPSVALAGGGCGIRPLPPIRPIGCHDMQAVCVCDATGDCHWEWFCTR